jgi:beta propeller repeat protein
MKLKVRKALLVTIASAAVLSATGCAAERIDPNESDQVAPAFNGDDVVWEDMRNDHDPQNDGTDVYMFQYSAGGPATMVAGGQGEQDQPAISDQYVVWIDRGTLKAQGLSNGQLSGPVITVTNGSATPTDPAICGSLVVWSDTANNSDIYAKNLSSGQLFQVATSPAVEAYPACDAGKIVYTYAPANGSSDIKLYDTSSRLTSTVSSEIWNEWRPSISGNLVVWQAWPAQPDTTQGFDILGKNIDTGVGFPVSTATCNQSAPVISGSTVAWEDTVPHAVPGVSPCGTQTQIWWRDIETTMSQVGIPVDSALAGSQQNPSLVNKQVAFQSDAPGPWSVYLAQLVYFAR